MTVLEGKAAIVTGSARGIGRATAELLCAQRSASARERPRCRPRRARPRRRSRATTAVFGGDLTQEGVCEALVEKAVAEFGRLDIVVNNAGYTWDGIAHKMSDEQFRAMLEIHTVAPSGCSELPPPTCASRRSRSARRGARCSARSST